MAKAHGKARRGKATGGFIDPGSYSRATLRNRPRVPTTKKAKKKEDNGSSDN